MFICGKASKTTGTETTEALSWGVIGKLKNGKAAYVAGAKRDLGNTPGASLSSHLGMVPLEKGPSHLATILWIRPEEAAFSSSPRVSH